MLIDLLRYFTPIDTDGRWSESMLEQHALTYLRRTLFVGLVALLISEYYSSTPLFVVSCIFGLLSGIYMDPWVGRKWREWRNRSDDV